MQEIKTIKLGIVNCYLAITDSGFILMDSGFSSSRTRLENELKKAGCLPGNLKLIILTHGDGDHAGNADYIRNKYNSKIAMHKNDLMMVVSFEENAKSLMNRQTRALSTGIILKLSMFITSFKFIKNIIKADYKSFRPDLFLEDGQNLIDHGFDAGILHIPGHTKGSIGILTGNSDLICGDILRNIGKPAVCPQGEDLNELDLSVEKLRQIKINMVYPGHGKPFQMKELRPFLTPEF